MKSAEAFLTKNGLPKWTKVERIAQGTETTIFKQYFKSWKEPEDSPYSGLRRVYPMESIGTFDDTNHIDLRDQFQIIEILCSRMGCW